MVNLTTSAIQCSRNCIPSFNVNSVIFRIRIIKMATFERKKQRLIHEYESSSGNVFLDLVHGCHLHRLHEFLNGLDFICDVVHKNETVDNGACHH